MLPPDDWLEEEPRPQLEGENLFYSKDLCKHPARSARSPSPLPRKAWTSGVNRFAKRAARTCADLLGFVADQFTHVSVWFLKRPKWTAINRHSCSVFMRLGSQLDRAAIWLLLRSR